MAEFERTFVGRTIWIQRNEVKDVKTVLGVLLNVILFSLCASRVFAGETDQFLVWGVELNDSAPAINDYINKETERYLDTINRRRNVPADPDEIVNGVYRNLFRGLQASKLRNWLQHSDQVDRYPPPTVSYWQYERMSVYKGRSFPYVLPMSRTVRIGDVYFGIDKFSHFFGFGRRSYNRYQNLREQGLDEQEALEGVVRRSIWWENTLVGKLVDGIFSHADIEASFQGCQLARNLCGGDDPNIQRVDGKWKLVRPVDLRDYVTPDFDESYNPNHYWALRKRFVLPLLEKEYGDKLSTPAVQERFATYRRHEPSLSVRVIERHFASQGMDPQKAQYRQVFHLPPRRLASNTGP